MRIVSIKRLIHSFRYANRGFWYVFRHEQNIRIHLAASFVVILLMLYFRVEVWQAVMLILVLAAVLVLELINTIFEKMVDILSPRIHFYAEVIKDVMAAAVLVASVAAVVIGILIFLPYLLPR